VGQAGFFFASFYFAISSKKKEGSDNENKKGCPFEQPSPGKPGLCATATV
jgi:hypothetical protein